MTKASESRRKRRFERRGRPTGSYRPLLKDRQRFSVATWLTLKPLFGPHIAARAAVVWIEGKTPITVESVEGLLLKIGADYEPVANGDLDAYSSQLADKARLVTSRATELEFAWLTQSSGALVALIKFIMEGDVAGFDQVLKVLRQVGWGEILDRIGRRLAPALLAKFPSFEGRLSDRAQHVLAILRALKT
jgi:hypothetical protein